jgi:tRNA pseudouridine38-40 synthase
MLPKDIRNIRLKLAYDGTDFSGWQRQEPAAEAVGQGSPPEKGLRTVQGLVEDALGKLHKKPIVLTGSGRTDTGVHAAAQVANFYTSIQSMEAARFVPALNSLLPHDVRVLEARETHKDFHARFDARLRTYRYFFLCRTEVLPWELRYAWRLKSRPSIARLNDYARLFRGEMDFTSFAVPGDKSKSRHRYISGASFFFDGGKLVFEISANAFLWKMVRAIAGTLIRFEEKGLSPDYLRKVIESNNKQLTGPTAPPQGLFLWNIDYGFS